MDRKLTTILATDVVGYASLMERDETGTHERLRENHAKLFEPEIARHRGHVFKQMGDGLLAEFGSVVSAVECAVSLQRGLAERNASVPEDQRIEVRIGINLGEVIVEGDDRFGEGVNIAARLEQIAEPGGICVSGKVVKEVERKLAFRFEPMGARTLKNINEPIEAFKVRLDQPPGKRHLPTSKAIRLFPFAVVLTIALLAGGGWLALRNSLSTAVGTVSEVVDASAASLVVLPFSNLSDDKEQGYFAAGITEDLTTELARVPGLFVISRNAALSYVGRTLVPAQIAKELGVRYVLEGSARRVLDDVRINAQLIDTQSGGHVWAERFDGQWGDVFTLQDQVITRVAAALKLQLAPGSVDSVGGTRSPAAYDAYLRAIQLQYSGTEDDWAKSLDGFESALAIDPEFGRAAAQIAWMYWSAAAVKSRLKALGVSENEISIKREESLSRAAKNPSSLYYQLLAESLLYQQKSDDAIVAAQRSIALDPSDSRGYEEMSWALTLNGRPQDGRDYLTAALRVDPGWTAWRYFMGGLAEFSMGNYADAAALLEELEPERGVASFWDFWGNYDGLRLLVSVYGHLGRQDDANAVKRRLKPLIRDAGQTDFIGIHMVSELPFKDFLQIARVLEGLQMARVRELPEGIAAESPNRLRGSEVAELIFEHAIEGRKRETGELWLRKTARDGNAEVTVGTDAFTTATTVEGDFLCSWSQRSGRACGSVFRNPDGALSKRNQYTWILPLSTFEFSVVQ